MVVTRSGSPTTGYVLLGNGTKYIGFDGSKYLLPSASLFLNFTGAALTGYGAAMCINYTGSNSLYGIVLKPGADTTYACVFMNTGDSPVGTISQTPTTCAYNTSSDGRLKEDLKSFDAGNIVDDTNVYDFAWKSTGERTYGVIGQQAIEVYPTAVTHDKEHDWYGVDYSKYVPVLLQELKALRARVAQLEGAAARPA
jgi:hypothetical protein